MGNITVTKKMELMRQIRSRYQQDRADMFRREQILYGRTSAMPEDDMYGLGKEGAKGSEDFISTLPLRFMLAAVMALVIALCDRSGGSFIGVPTDKIFQAISADYESSIAAWADTALHKNPEGSVSGDPPAGRRP